MILPESKYFTASLEALIVDIATVVWEAIINQAKLDEFNSYIEGVEIIVDPTYTVTVQGLEEN